MSPQTTEQLRQYVNQSKASHAQSALGRFEQELQARDTSQRGMLNPSFFENRTQMSAKDSTYFATPQAPAPEGGGMSVMCTLMREYGYLEDDVFDADTLFGHLIATTHPEILIGYHAWAKPLTEFLRNNAIYIPLFAYIVQAWAYEMAEQFGIVKNRSTFKRLVGKIVMNVGKPVCGFIGTVISSSQGNYEYHRT
jgi:hypothetical protein